MKIIMWLLVMAIIIISVHDIWANGLDDERNRVLINQKRALWERSKENAMACLLRVSGKVEDINHVKLVYTAKIQYFISLDVSVIMEMKRAGFVPWKNKGLVPLFEASIIITPPIGSEPLSDLIFKLIGKRTAKYKRTMNDYGVEIRERFFYSGDIFRTYDIEEFRIKESAPEKKFIKAIFDEVESKIIFYADKLSADKPDSLDYDGQVGPVTGFFNYIFNKYDNVFAVLDIVECRAKQSGGGRIPYKLMRAQDVSLMHSPPDGSGLNKVIEFSEGNYFGMIRDFIWYDELSLEENSLMRMPFVIRIEALFDIGKRKSRLRQLIEEYPERSDFSQDLFINSVIFDRKVMVYLTEAVSN